MLETSGMSPLPYKTNVTNHQEEKKKTEILIYMEVNLSTHECHWLVVMALDGLLMY